MSFSKWFTRRDTTTSSRPRRTRRLGLEALEDRVQPAAGVRSIDGTDNNPFHSNWGSAGTDLLRTAPAAYADGVSTPGGTNRPNARVISNTIADQGSEDIISDRLLSAMIYAWGQFVDHDLDLTTTGTTAFDIPVPKGDPFFDPNSTGTQVIPLDRSNFDEGTGIKRNLHLLGAAALRRRQRMFE